MPVVAHFQVEDRYFQHQINYVTDEVVCVELSDSAAVDPLVVYTADGTVTTGGKCAGRMSLGLDGYWSFVDNSGARHQLGADLYAAEALVSQLLIGDSNV